MSWASIKIKFSPTQLVNFVENEMKNFMKQQTQTFNNAFEFILYNMVYLQDDFIKQSRFFLEIFELIQE